MPTTADAASPPATPRTGRTAVRAHAAVRVERGTHGAPRLAELRSDVPIVLRLTDVSPVRTGTGAGVAPLPTMTVHLVNGAAGPLAGDDLRLDISVGSGVRLVLRSVAATVALPGHGPGPSRLTVTAEVADGGELDFGPEPTVVADGADHRVITDVRLAATARLRLREEILLGRFGEPTGSILSTLRIDVAHAADAADASNAAHASGGARTAGDAAGAGGPAGWVPLLRQELLLGPRVPGLRGPAQLGGARAVGSLLVAGPEWAGPGPEAAVAEGVGLLPLTGPGYLVSALADDAVTLRRRLTAAPGSTG
ncbi:urease accessory protein UreD [Frankia sp. QA3]|uniref:urease accessory protein UreD n=1 Tax=Frankia sp. QA3 TaxID=710111 RepID=UPI000269CA93|nr:urease accessory protein UreD [Frankia sp. QA3]EIV93816.1 urease accessory protein UreH [Frankia sp. QA3]